MPPRCPEFYITRIEYPVKDCTQVAFGNSVQLSIEFKSDALKIVRDELIVISDCGQSTIELFARPEKHKLEYDFRINKREAFVGDEISALLRVVNNGGG